MTEDADSLLSGYKINPTEQDEYIVKMFGDEDFALKCHRHGLKAELFAGRPRQATVREIYHNLNSYSTSGNLTMDNLRILLRNRSIPQQQKDEINDFLTQLETDSTIKTSSNGYYAERLDYFVTTRTVKLIQDMLITAPPEANAKQVVKQIEEIITEYRGAQIPGSGTRLRTAKLVNLPPVVSRFNIKPLDYALGVGEDRGGIREGDLAMLLGYTGTGKSWCMIHLGKHALLRGQSVLLLSTELGRDPIINRFAQNFYGITRKEYMAQRHKLVQGNQWKSHFAKHSELIIYGLDEWSLGADSLEALWQENCDRIERKIGLVLVDSADELTPPSYAQRSTREYDRQGATYEVLRNFAEKQQVGIVATAQTNRKGGDRFWLDSRVVADSHKKSMKAQIGISINASEAELKLGYVRFWVWKYTHGEAGTRLWVQHRYDVGQLHIESGYYNKEQYDQAVLSKITEA